MAGGAMSRKKRAHQPYLVVYEADTTYGEPWKITNETPIGIAVERFHSKRDAVKRAEELAKNQRRPGVVVYSRTSVETGDSVFGEPHRFIPNDEYFLKERWRFLPEG